MVELPDEYDASKIIVLEGAQGVRKRPAMYIGSTGTAGVVHLLFEVFDNSVDEALAGYAKDIEIRLTQTETGDIAEVSDNGRGIPIDIMPKYGKSALEVIMTTLHKGAKFDNEVYKVSGGLHGVGLTVVNALSEFTEVTVRKGGKEYIQSFSKGLPTSELKVVGDNAGAGTTLKFKPDPEIFPSPAFDSISLKERLRYTSFLNPGLRIKLVDDRFSTHEETQFLSEKGIEDFVAYINREQQTIGNILHARKAEGTVVIDFALQYTGSYDERMESFVNNIKTNGGGTHVVGFRSGLTRAILNYISKNSKNNLNGPKITGDDTREGLTTVLEVMMQNPEFEGQTKEKLGNTEMKSIVETAVYSALSRYLEEHPADARRIVEKVMNAMNARESARKARELARKRSAFESAVLPGKLSDCILDDPEKVEIFIVEGESAGGSSKQGRDKNIQAILPLKGKILNVEKASDEKIFENIELNTLVTALGAGIRENFNSEKARYHKIIIMSDADVDGSHIRTLLLTFFYRYMKRLIELGYVYAAQPPLYKATAGKEVSYCYTDDELESVRAKFGGKLEVQRYKGLGEMNPEQLWETTMSPEKRVLKQIKIFDAEKANSLFTILMGMDVAPRRKFLEEHAGDVKFLDV